MKPALIPTLHAAACEPANALGRSTWRLPVEVALALPASSVIAQLSRERLANGERALPIAQLLLRGDRFFTAVDFAGPGRRGLVFAVDVWTRAPP
jgi:hypothetical protein